MNKTIKKVLTGLALSACIASTAGALTHVTDVSVSKAATSAYTVTNIEDLITSGIATNRNKQTNQIAFGYDDAYLYPTTSTPLNTVNATVVPNSNSEINVNWALYTDAKEEDAATSDTTKAQSVNMHDGNITVSTNPLTYTGNKSTVSARQAFRLQVPKNTVISYRMTFRRDLQYYFVYDSTQNSSWASTPGTDGCFVHLRTDWDSSDTTLGNTAYIYENYYTTAGTRAGQQVIKKGHSRIDTIAEGAPQNGEEVIVTYGSYKVTEGDSVQTWHVFKMVTASGTTLFDWNVQDTNEYNTYYKNDYDSADTVYMSFGACKIDPFKDATQALPADSTINTSVSGINRPILTDNYDVAGKAGTYYAGQSASVALPEGYTLADENAVLALGENEIAVNYTIEDYYGKTATVPCTMTVTAEEAHTLTLKNADGTTMESIPVYGSSYTLATKANEGQTFVGWANANGELYPAGYELAISEDVELTLVEFSLTDGAAVRVANTNGNFGGLRFEVQVAEALKEIVFGNAIDLYGAILPTDSLADNDFTEADIATATEKDSVTAITLENTSVKDGKLVAYFTLTNVLTTNYNRAFSGMAYVTVAYANDTTATICSEYTKENNSRTIMDVVYSAYYDTTAAYDDTQMNVLKAYLNAVVYVDLDNEIEAETVSVLGENYNVYNEYSLSNVTGSGFTLTTSVTYSASSDGSIHIPVFVLQNGVLSRVTTTATAVEGGYTVTFSI